MMNDELQQRYPRTMAAFAAMGADDHLERIIRLDAVWQGIRHAVATNQPSAQQRSAWRELPAPEFAGLARHVEWRGDLVYVGAGLGLLHALEMARHGWRVLVCDRGEVGCAHREWNISYYELAALVAIGSWSWHELQSVIMNEYSDGIVRFFTENDAAITLHLPEVLNVAIDAGALLRLARTKFLQAGGEIRDYRLFGEVVVSSNESDGILLDVTTPTQSIERYQARLVVDGMGTVSPLSLQRFGGRPYAGVCPTVGTVASGFAEGTAANQHNRSLGDILVTIADAQKTQQYMWEGFPGREDELTIYLFYYDTLHPGKKTMRPTPNLLELFEDYFALLPDYKRSDGVVQHHKPVYGYIPARHSLRRLEAPLLRGVLAVGDAAAQQSPLTFCGFGSHVRNLRRTTSLLDLLLQAKNETSDLLALVTPYQANVSLNWVFSRFMQPWGDADNDVNQLQGHFMRILARRGTDFATRFFRDEMRWSDYHKMVLGMLFVYPAIMGIAGKVLQVRGCTQWFFDYLRFTGDGMLAAAGRMIGTTVLQRMALDLPVQWRIRLLAKIAEWQVMGWDH